MPDLFKDTPPPSATSAPNVLATQPKFVPEKKAETPPPKPDKPFDPKAGAKKLMEMMTAPTTDEREETPGQEPEPSVETPAEKPKAEGKPIKVKKKEPVVEKRPEIPKASDLEQGKSEPVAPKKAEAPAEEEDFEKSLLEEERALLEDARGAEKYLSEKYKGHASKMEKFLKEAATKSMALGDDPTAEEEEDYKKWYDEARPKIAPLDLRNVERARMKEEVKKDFEPELERERHARWAETEAPKIEARAPELRAEIWASAIPDEVMQAANERTKGVEDPTEKSRILNDVSKEYAMEMEIATQITDEVRDVVLEFNRVSAVNPKTGKPLKAIHPEAEILDRSTGRMVPNLNSPDPEIRHHAAILAMVTEVCEEFKSGGGADLKRDGKWFVTREEWAGMAPAQRAGFWTFSNAELIKRATSNVKNAVRARVQMQRDYLEKRGWKRVSAAPAVVPAAAGAPPPVAPSTGAPPAPRISPPPSQQGARLTPAQIQAKELAGKLSG
jgi:hypothetical protein